MHLEQKIFLFIFLAFSRKLGKIFFRFEETLNVFKFLELEL